MAVVSDIAAVAVSRNPFRATFAAIAVITTIVVLLLLREMGQSPWWAVPLAWNPLLVLETGGMGHQDVLGAMLTLLGFYALLKTRDALCGALLALVAAVKPFALLLTPFVIRDARQKTGMLVAFVGVLIAAYLPPMLYQQGYDGWLQSVATYSQSWEANGSVYEVVTRPFRDREDGHALMRTKGLARILAGAAVVVTAVVAWRLRASPATAGYFLCLVTLLVSPVMYPWYLIWPLSFVPLLGGRAGWTVLVWSGTAGISYLVRHDASSQLSNTAMLMEYLPVYAALAAEFLIWRRRRSVPSRPL